MRLFVIHNPAAGRDGRDLYRSVLGGLESAGCRLSVCDTDGPGHATRLAEKAEECDRIVVVGGDGTINEVINGLAVPPDRRFGWYIHCRADHAPR